MDQGKPHPEQTGGIAVTVEKFTVDQVVLHRTDFGQFPGRADLQGKVSNNGNAIVNGLITWTYHPCCGLGSGGFNAAWGPLIERIPGSGSPPPHYADGLVGGNATKTAAAAGAPAPSVPAESTTSSNASPAAAAPPAARVPLVAPIAPAADLAKGEPIPTFHFESGTAAKPSKATMLLTEHVKPAFDLNGIWQTQQFVVPGTRTQVVQRLLIVQIKDKIEGINLDWLPIAAPGQSSMVAKFDTPTTLVARERTWGHRGIDIPTGDVVWGEGTIKISDANHMQSPDSKLVYTRQSSIAAPADITCNPHNPSHVSADVAWAMSSFYTFLSAKGDPVPAEAVCWAYVGAVQGQNAAQYDYALSLWQGNAVAKDHVRAFAWYQRSAVQGNPYAAAALDQMFSTGDGTPASTQRAQYWHDRGIKTNDDYVRENPPQWARDISGPCDPANPLHVDGGAALRMGRVSYEARALVDAACWFQIGANAGNRKSNAYLGVMYAFGMGVKRDAPRGFALEKNAADAGDVYAKASLANFYRYGIGTKVDEGAFTSLWQEVTREDAVAWLQVQGIQSIFAGKRLADVLSAFSGALGTCDPNVHTQADIAQYNACASGQSSAEHNLLTPNAAQHTVDYPEEIFPEKKLWGPD